MHGFPIVLILGLLCWNGKALSASAVTQEVRLSDGEDPTRGRLEVYYNGSWGTVCDNRFDDIDASVACLSLGFGSDGHVAGNRYGPGVGAIWLDNVQCTGNETSLFSCRHGDFGVTSCQHSDDVSVWCGAVISTPIPINENLNISMTSSALASALIASNTSTLSISSTTSPTTDGNRRVWVPIIAVLIPVAFVSLCVAVFITVRVRRRGGCKKAFSCCRCCRCCKSDPEPDVVVAVRFTKTDPRTHKETVTIELSSSDAMSTPIYWISYSRPQQPTLAEVVVNMGHAARRTELLSDNPLFAAVKRLVEGSWTSGVVGLGRDASGLMNSRIMVQKVFLIESPLAYMSYMNRRNEMHMKLARRGIPQIRGLLGEQEVKSRTLGITELDNMVDYRINEYYLMHGTRQEKVQRIVDQGLDFRVQLATGRIFGQGVYLAESSTKSDQYSDSAFARTAAGNTLNMFVVRTLLGSVYVSNSERAFRKPPCCARGCYTEDCRVHTTDAFDSVMGVKRTPTDARLLFREFIVYDRSQCYPEFLVEYTRTN